MSAKSLGGKLLVSGGKPRRCCCPQSSGVAACCVGTPPLNVFLWLALSRDTSLGCFNTPTCPTGGGASDQYFATVAAAIPFMWNTAAPSTVFGTLGCASVRIKGQCSGGSFESTYSVDYGSGYLSERAINFNADANCGNFDPATCATDADQFASFATTRDPSTGILTPDGNVVPTSLTFNITESGVPYTCTLTFAPTGVFLPGFSIGTCYAWYGCYNNCNGVSNRVGLLYGDDGAGGNKWQLYVWEGSLKTVYFGTSYPTFGVTADTFGVCGSGLNPLWSLT